MPAPHTFANLCTRPPGPRPCRPLQELPRHPPTHHATLNVILLFITLSASAWDSYYFDLPSGASESSWRDALAAKVNGVTEATLVSGRADVATSNEVFEVDWIRNWKQGMGQTLAYSGASGKLPVLALIAYGQGVTNLTASTREKLTMAETECARHSVRLLILFPTHPELPHSRPSPLTLPKEKISGL